MPFRLLMTGDNNEDCQQTDRLTAVSQGMTVTVPSSFNTKQPRARYRGLSRLNVISKSLLCRNELRNALYYDQEFETTAEAEGTQGDFVSRPSVRNGGFFANQAGLGDFTIARQRAPLQRAPRPAPFCKHWTPAETAPLHRRFWILDPVRALSRVPDPIFLRNWDYRAEAEVDIDSFHQHPGSCWTGHALELRQFIYPADKSSNVDIDSFHLNSNPMRAPDNEVLPRTPPLKL
ncbi:hypothetical protein G7K_3686-t1 [Saitoella complicata NRRL Y-17804]|uniref:Uncharacterized protein n=1 Tax=Saitoella complicata (strain BCRC 22490 / CBS 7301 / JCM 7358 / NBRC 10748 / NRRL Y-17804) TaxID=698492 RepID=A0A0E9NI43_SAICN|nr:hypothetical protein G7K_3686-t1 [Saitoella complicata NRRL Y-17804]